MTPRPPRKGSSRASENEASTGRGRRSIVTILLVLALILILAPPAQSATPTTVPDQGDRDDCQKSGTNMQCNRFGSIEMPSQRHIRGDTISLTTTVTIEDTFADQGARYILFSVRNVTDSREQSAVALQLQRFGTESAEIAPMRTDTERPNEVTLWVSVLDTPRDTPIMIDLKVDATRAGAHTVETLIMPFDRGYAPINDADGKQVSLYAFTLLGVNEPTGETFDTVQGPVATAVPGASVSLLLAASGMTLVLARRRSA